MTACCPFSGNTFKQIFLLFVFSHNSLRSMLLTVITSERSLLATQNTTSLSVTLFPCFSSVQFSRSVTSDSATPWIAACQASLSITNSWSSLKLMSIELVMPFSHLILCCHLLFLPLIPPSIRVFSSESVLPIRWPKYWRFSFNISPSNEYSRLISFRIDWFDLLAVQGTLKSLLQHHRSKSAILRHSALFIVQFSHPYMTTGNVYFLLKVLQRE